MRRKRTSLTMAVLALATVTLTGCGAGNQGESFAREHIDPNATISVFSNEPQSPLIPADTGEVFGGRVVDMLFQGLRSYDDKGNPVNELAESINSSDAQHYEIRLKSGRKFTNDEPITAQTFVNTWNFAALSTNNMSNGSFFASIQGYDDVSATEGSGKDAKPAPKAQTMSGLKVVDDTTFTVQLSEPESDWPVRLGYAAFYPLPSAALTDPKTYGQKPVGNGPYKLKTPDSWVHDKSIELVRNDAYEGPRKAKNGGVAFQFYTSSDSAYTDVQAGILDITDVIPSTSLSTYETDLKGHSLNKPSATNESVIVPEYLPELQGETGKLRRQAISKAIDRGEICKVVFKDTRTPAKEFSAPSIPGYKEGLPGSSVLNFNKNQARDLWDQANKQQPWPENKTLTIAYNTDGGNKEWVDAVANQLKNTLGIKAEGKPYPKFASMLEDRRTHRLDGLVRGGWQGDYPSLYNFLHPVLGTGTSSNYDGYSNPAFDQLLEDGLNSRSVEAGAKKFQEAETLLLKDLPTIPLWYVNTQVGWSEKVADVDIDWRGQVKYYDIVKAQ